MVSLTFLLASGCFWNMLQKVTVQTVLLSGLSIAALMLSKLTGVFFVPMALGLIVVRLASHRPLTVRFFRTWQVISRPGQMGVLLISILVQGMIVVVTIWAVFGFRYSAYNPRLGDYAYRSALWERALARPGIVSDGFTFAHDHRLLPEAYLYSLASIQGDVQERKAFLNGQYSYHGWRRYFPYAFLVKTPLTLLAVVVLSAVAAGVKWRRAAREKGKDWRISAKEALYATAPLWMLLGVYWLGAITSKLNIGHRHILPVYPPMLVLAGGAAYWLTARSKTVGAFVIVALLALAAETVYCWPNYIPYFNQLVGGPSNGYKHLVDSSLDWGQDLPSLKRWFQEQNLGDQAKTPVYLCYFGTASPTYYGIGAGRFPGYVNLDSPPMPLHLGGGYYCVSATMLQSVVPEPFGGWTKSQEDMYRSARESVLPLLQMNTDQRSEIFRGPTGPYYQRQWMAFDRLRQKRMMAYLRQREPLHQVNHTILIYRLSDQNVEEALAGPPPELRPPIGRDD